MNRTIAPQKWKTSLDSLCRDLRKRGWESRLTRETVENIIGAGFRGKNLELDALPPTEIRRRVKSAIKLHIPEDTWQRLRTVEEAERESFNKVLAQIHGGTA